MFWKRKGKKKDDEAAAGGTATATADAEETAEDAAETSEESERTDQDQPETAEAGASTEEDTGPDPIQRVRTNGVFQVDGEEYAVATNTYIVEVDDDGVLVIDPAHDAEAIMAEVGEREVYLIACTNGYSTHVSAAVEVAERDEAPIALHRKEVRSWRRVNGAENRPDLEVEGDGTLEIGEVEVRILATPGTASGSVGYYIPELNAVFTGDTLLNGEIGTVGEGYVDYTTQLASVGEVLLSLPEDTRVLPDRDEETTVGAEQGNFDRWVTGD